MRSEPQHTVRTYATFRIVGDDLAPDEITELFKFFPTQACARGETYSAVPRSQDLRRQTGVWMLSTDKLVASDDLNDHLRFLLWLLLRFDPNNPLNRLKGVLERYTMQAVVNCFWNGPAGAKHPVISPSMVELLRSIPAKIETDFNSDESSTNESL
jgi:hypothetical protein